ncbi:hypothetical protein QUF64_09780 [Anaerolineales bacterium HSG6]|nr:hypothetical protein [Anaerolineales bacterium HSG6]
MQTLKPITFETVLSMVKQLSLTDQIRLLEWIARQVKQTLSQTFQQTSSVEMPTGVSGKQLLQFAGLIPPDELQQISQAIETDCARIDFDEW